MIESERGAEASADLQLAGVGHTFRTPNGALTVLSRVSFRVRPGEFVTLVGPSGCGKSTLLNVIAGFLTPSEGSVLVNGRPVGQPSPDRGIVLQKPALFPWLSVLDNVLFGPTVRGHSKEARARGLALLAEMGLGRSASLKPYELSGGMQQRAAIARTLMNDPKLLLMDEPFAALDAVTRGEMQELLLRIVEQRTGTVLFVTHDIEEAILLSDRIVVLSANPGSVFSEVEVPIPRPRSYGVVMTGQFVDLRREVVGMFRDMRQA